MIKLVKLYDEVELMTSLKTDTVVLIKKTNFVEAMKRLIMAHDIIVLNLDIQERFRSSVEDLPIWDDAALNDLKNIRRELIVYYQNQFSPTQSLYDYCKKMGHLFQAIDIRKRA